MFGLWVGSFVLWRIFSLRSAEKVINMIRKTLVRLSAGTAALVASGAALATEPTAVDNAVSAIDGGAASVAAIGGAALVVLAGAVVFKLIRRAL